VHGAGRRFRAGRPAEQAAVPPRDLVDRSDDVEQPDRLGAADQAEAAALSLHRFHQALDAEPLQQLAQVVGRRADLPGHRGGAGAVSRGHLRDRRQSPDRVHPGSADHRPSQPLITCDYAIRAGEIPQRLTTDPGAFSARGTGPAYRNSTRHPRAGRQRSEGRTSKQVRVGPGVATPSSVR
jgi:hypothetical protein